MVTMLLISDDAVLVENFQCVVGVDLDVAQSRPVDATHDICVWDVTNADIFEQGQWAVAQPIRVLIGNASQVDEMLTHGDAVEDIWLKPLPSTLLQMRIQTLWLAGNYQRSLNETLHQLKNPLSTIRGYSDVLLKMSGHNEKLPPLVESQHKFVSAIYNASGKMQVMMDALSHRLKSSID